MYFEIISIKEVVEVIFSLDKYLYIQNMLKFWKQLKGRKHIKANNNNKKNLPKQKKVSKSLTEF